MFRNVIFSIIQFVSAHLIDKIFLDKIFLSYMYGHWSCKAMIDVLEYQRRERKCLFESEISPL